MYSHERKAKILELLEQNSSVRVNELTDKLGTSKETIRRDLRELEHNGVLTRVHGGATLNLVGTASSIPVHENSLTGENPFVVRQVQHVNEKKVICKKAVSYIKNNDIIFMDSSSTTLFLLQFLPKDISLTIITNSIKVLLDATNCNNPNLTLILLSGFYDPNNYSLFGSRTVQSAEEFYPNKSFISCTGISLQHHLTGINLHEVDTKRAIIEKSNEVFLLADHSKFETRGPFHLTNFNSISHIITDAYEHSSVVNKSLEIIRSENSIEIIFGHKE